MGRWRIQGVKTSVKESMLKGIKIMDSNRLGHSSHRHLIEENAKIVKSEERVKKRASRII